jgi:hypothetical protein
MKVANVQLFSDDITIKQIEDERHNGRLQVLC